MIIITLLVASVLSAPAYAAPSSDASFASMLSAGQTQISAKFVAASWNEEQALLELLRDRDVEVRRQAVRSLKAWVAQRTSTRDRVLEVFEDRNEELSVRREAAKTLSVVTTYPVVYRALLDYAQRGSDVSLRAISYKALYWAAAQRSDVRDDILDAARRENDRTVRLAAIWTLFAVNGNPVKDVLIDIAERDTDGAVRVEALKSLYGLMGYSDVRDLAYDLARNPNVPTVVRRAAILLHSNRVSSRQKDMLEEIATRDHDPLMRTAAIIALGNPRSEELQTYFHLIRRDHNGVLVSDPLDAE